MRMPTSCAAGHLAEPRELLGGADASPRRTFKMTPTGCNSLPFSAKAEGSMGAPGDHEGRRVPAGDHHAEVRSRGRRAEARRGDPAARARAEPRRAPARLPARRRPTRAAAPRARAWAPRSSTRRCSRRRCAARSTSRSTPTSRAAGADGDAPAAGGRAAGRRGETGQSGTKNTFASNPDLPVRSFTLSFDGGRPDSALVADPGPLRRRHRPDDGGEAGRAQRQGVEFEQELATPGCDPRAKVSRCGARAARATLVARVRAARVGPGVTGSSP